MSVTMVKLLVPIATAWREKEKPACSHIAALLYAVMTKAKLRNEVACTCVLCKWMEPSQTTTAFDYDFSLFFFFYSQASFATINDIKFFNPLSTFNAAFQFSDSKHSEQHDAAKSIDVMPPHIAEMNEFYARLHVANPKAAILSIIPGYSETFNSSSSLPPIMLDFAKPEYMDLKYADLLNECENIFC